MSGIKGLFNKKKNKSAEKAAKAAAKDQDDGEWLAAAPVKAAPVRVKTSGKVVEDYCPEVVEEVRVDARTQMEIDETKKMLLEVQKRQQEAEAAKPVEEVKPVAPTGLGMGGIDWRAKTEERRLKEMEKNKEKDFPTLGGDKPAQAAPVPEKKTETIFAVANEAEAVAVKKAEPEVKVVPPAAEEPVVEKAPETPVAAAVAAVTEGVANVEVSATPAEEEKSTATKKPKKKKGSYMDF